MTDSQTGWRKRAIEALLVVVSILLAFMIDAVWDARNEANLESMMVDAVVAQLHDMRASIAGSAARNEARVDAIDVFFRGSKESLSALPPDSAALILQALPNGESFVPSLDAARMYLATPVRDRESLEERADVAAVLSAWEEAREGHELFSDLRAGVRSELSRFAIPQLEQGVGSIVTMTGRGGPQVLGELREDPSLLRAVIEKSHFQRVFAGELRAFLLVTQDAAERLAGN